MSFSTKKAQRLRSRLMPRMQSMAAQMPAPVPASGRLSSLEQLQERISHLQDERSSQSFMRQTMIVQPRQLQWWEKEVVEYAFSHPHVRNRLERLMGSNVTRLTDREFMQRLAERIQEEHVGQMQKRIRAREEAEVEREKKLILEGKIPVEQVPNELVEHPVFKITRITTQVIDVRRSKVQHPSMRPSHIPSEALSAIAKFIAPEDEEGGEAGEDIQVEKEISKDVEVESEADKEEFRVLLKEELEEKVEKEEEMRALADVNKDTAKTQVGGRETEEGLKGQTVEDEGLEDEESETIADDKLLPEVEPSIIDIRIEDLGTHGKVDKYQFSDEDKRDAIIRRSQEMKARRWKQASSRSVFIDAPEDGRPLSPEKLASERAHIQRKSVMFAAHSEWEAEMELNEVQARERDKNYVLSETELRRLRYEAPLIEELRKQETVADLYRLADEIVGGLWIKPTKSGK